MNEDALLQELQGLVGSTPPPPGYNFDQQWNSVERQTRVSNARPSVQELGGALTNAAFMETAGNRPAPADAATAWMNANPELARRHIETLQASGQPIPPIFQAWSAGSTPVPQQAPPPSTAGYDFNSPMFAAAQQPQQSTLPPGPPLNPNPEFRLPPGTPQEPTWQDAAWDRARAFGQGAMLGGGDELYGIGAGLRSMTRGEDFGQGFTTGRNAINAEMDSFRRSNPGEALAWEVGGTVLPSIIVPGSWQSGAPLAGNVARTGTAGGVIGGVNAALNDQNPLLGTLIGAGAGAGIPAAAGGIMRGAQSIARGIGGLFNRTPAPTTQALKDASQALFRAADQSGAIIAPNAAQSGGNAMEAAVQGLNLDAAVHPMAARAIDRVQTRLTAAMQGGGLRFEEIANLRQIITDAIGAAGRGTPDERVATALSREFNRFLDDLTPQDIVMGWVRDPATGQWVQRAGDIDAAMAAYRQGQQAWGRYLRSAELDEMMRVAEATPAGYEQGLINQFRQLYRDPERWGRYTPEEQAAIREVIQGGPVGSVLRLFGKAAPTGVVSAGGGVGIGALFGGAPGALAVPAAGMASKLTADALTRASANRVAQVVRSGSSVNIPAGVRRIIDALSSTAGRGGAANQDDLAALFNAGASNRAIIDALSAVPQRRVQSFQFLP